VCRGTVEDRTQRSRALWGLPSCRGARHGRLQAPTDHRQLIEHLEGLVVVDKSRKNIRIEHVPPTRRVHDRASALTDGHEALFFDSLHGFADHRATHGKLLAQGALWGEDV